MWHEEESRLTELLLTEAEVWMRVAAYASVQNSPNEAIVCADKVTAAWKKRYGQQNTKQNT